MQSDSTDLPSPINHVFVDFENVHEIDLAVIGSKFVTFTLLVGSRQTKLDISLVEKLFEHAAAVQLVRLTSAGKNALDFALAYYVGRAVAADPTGCFHIVSKDKGYNPLVEYLLSKHIQIQRHDDFDALVFSTQSHGKPVPSKPTASKIKAGPIKKNISKTEAADMEALKQAALANLRKLGAKTPKSKKRLISHLKAQLSLQTEEAVVLDLIEIMDHAAYLAIDDKGKIIYSLPAP